MGYTFAGVFIGGDSIGVEEAARLFDGYAREISKPFRGVIVSFDDDKWVLDTDATKVEVLKRSQLLGEVTLAYVHYETWAGPCDYCYGFACRNGQILEENEAEGEQGNEVLCQMQKCLGVTYPSSNFPPFEREFFPNT